MKSRGARGALEQAGSPTRVTAKGPGPALA